MTRPVHPAFLKMDMHSRSFGIDNGLPPFVGYDGHLAAAFVVQCLSVGEPVQEYCKRGYLRMRLVIAVIFIKRWDMRLSIRFIIIQEPSLILVVVGVNLSLIDGMRANPFPHPSYADILSTFPYPLSNRALLPSWVNQSAYNSVLPRIYTTNFMQRLNRQTR